MTSEKRIPEAVAASNLTVLLDKVALEHVPRFIIGEDDAERGVIVNAAWFRQLTDKAEEFDRLASQPVYGVLRKQLADAKGRASAYADMLDRQAADLLAKACPRCRELLGSAKARKDRVKGVWSQLKVSLSEAADGLNPPDRQVFVGVAGVGGDDQLDEAGSTEGR